MTRENPKGSGFLNGKHMGNRWGGMETMRSVYEQPGTRVDGSCHSKEGSKEVKGTKKGEQRGISKGEKSKGTAPHVL